MNHKQLERLRVKMIDLEYKWQDLRSEVDNGIHEIVKDAIKSKPDFTVVQAEYGLQGYEIVIATPPEEIKQEEMLVVYREIKALLEKALPDLEFEEGGTHSYPHQSYWHMMWVAHNRF